MTATTVILTFALLIITVHRRTERKGIVIVSTSKSMDRYNQVITYPNPVDDIFFINIPGLWNHKYSGYKLIDLQGKLILIGEITSNKFSINTSQLNKGVYLLKINANPIQITEKIIKI